MRSRKTKIKIIENNNNNSDNDNNSNNNGSNNSIASNTDDGWEFENVGDFMLSKNKKYAIIHKSHIFESVDSLELLEVETDAILSEINLYPVENIHLTGQKNDKIEQIINSLPMTITKITIKMKATQIINLNDKTNTYAFNNFIKMYNLPSNLKSLAIKINKNYWQEYIDFNEFLNIFKQKMKENIKLPFGCDFRIEQYY